MKKTISLVLVLSLLFSVIPVNAFASNPTISNDYRFSLNSDIIIEYVTVTIDNQVIYITRTTYSDNSCTVEIVENNIRHSFEYTADFQKLYFCLSSYNSGESSSQQARASGYEYIYMKTDVFTDYYTPENATYSTIFACFSSLLSPYHLKASTLAALASLVLAGSSSRVKTKVVTTMHWYYKMLDGEFVSYYCQYSCLTYTLREDGTWAYIGKESDTMESLTVW